MLSVCKEYILPEIKSLADPFKIKKMITRRKAFKTIGILSGISLLTGAFPASGISAFSIFENKKNSVNKNRILIVGSNNHWVKPILDYGHSNDHNFTITDSITLQNAQDFQQLKISISENQLSSKHKFEDFLKSNVSFDTVYFCGIRDPYDLSLKALSLGYNVWVDRPVNLKHAHYTDVQKILKNNSVTFLISHLTHNGIILGNHQVFA